MISAFIGAAPCALPTSKRPDKLCSKRTTRSIQPPKWRASVETKDEKEVGSDTWVPASELSNPTQWETVMSIEEIMKVLPHRFPFLLIDRVIAFEPGKRAIAVKNVSMNEPFFPGHFPDRPIMPGVMQVEALAQVGGIVMLQQPVSDGKGDFFFGGVDNVKWKKPVLPGDTLVLEMTLDKFRPRFGIAKMIGK
ncbi:beta-hydroxyacyl-ACP dehydratase [Gracilaria domingensis]|nr:beta-hydroxyacyl-ACP dehydratase [Gracilaria domingensis]